ncbi:hypothetical protein KUCAC02_036907, partial [Chaenocephalus aceratus]
MWRTWLKTAQRSDLSWSSCRSCCCRRKNQTRTALTTETLSPESEFQLRLSGLETPDVIQARVATQRRQFDDIQTA